MALEACKKCKRWKEVKERLRISELLAKVIEQFEQRMSSQTSELKPTLGDYLKLVQLEREYEQDEVREIKVSWVDPSESKS